MSLITFLITFTLLHLLSNGSQHFETTPSYTLKELGLEEHLNQLLKEKRHNSRRLGTLSTDHKRDLLDIHNDGRSQTATGGATGQPKASNMNLLVWDDGLAATAAQYAEVCVWGHSTSSWRNTAYSDWQASNPGQGITGPATNAVGENLYISSADGLSDAQLIANLLSGIQAWYDEYIYYTYDTGACTTGEQCGHYTQMVWGTTTHVGCGWHECTGTIPGLPDISYWTDGATYLVCHYYQAGNYIGQKPYTQANNDAAICTTCSTGMDVDCHNGLCTNCPQNNCPDGLGRSTFRPTAVPTLPTPSPTQQPIRSDPRIELSGFTSYNYGGSIGVLDLNGEWSVYDSNYQGYTIYKHPTRDFAIKYISSSSYWGVMYLEQVYSNSWTIFTSCYQSDILICDEGEWNSHSNGKVDPVTSNNTPEPTDPTPSPTASPVTPEPTPTPDPTSSPVTPDPTASPVTPQPTNGGSNTCTYTAPGIRYTGNRIARITGTANIEACCQECHNNAECIRFRYNNNGNCDILRTNTGQNNRNVWTSGEPV